MHIVAKIIIFLFLATIFGVGLFFLTIYLNRAYTQVGFKKRKEVDI